MCVSEFVCLCVHLIGGFGLDIDKAGFGAGRVARMFSLLVLSWDA